ncbi:uncharacterized protein [Dysidea avara]|uniref:uncharacterized protein n=1 Tax=Dysidea avara TaxID=196820 RepID=UPI00332D1BE5
MKGFEEFRYCRMEIQQLQHTSPFECPACHRKQHSAHVDGNKKLYRFDKVPRGIRDSYYKGTFFVNNEEVDHHLELVNYHDDTQPGMCGTSRWKAAKSTSKTMRGLDETGVVVAGCRHIIAQKAVNMFRGEIYGYTHFLHMNYLTHRNLSYLIHDVICKYWPWTSSVHYSGNSSGNEMIPCLPVMHAKAHTWHCQMELAQDLGRIWSCFSATFQDGVRQLNTCWLIICT